MEEGKTRCDQHHLKEEVNEFCDDALSMFALAALSFQNIKVV